jgi:predicted metalloprotease
MGPFYCPADETVYMDMTFFKELKTRYGAKGGDIEEAMSAAHAVGDDTIQKRARGYIEPDSFTHGTSEERKESFMRGFNSGKVF